jgi:hypothetical protein
MQDLTALQEELKKIILTFEEKVSGNKIDNKHQIKQFNSLVRNEDINEDLINFIIDSTDEINTRHFQFVEHTTKTIKDLSDITHKDIEKLKKIIENNNTDINKKSDKSTTDVPWFNVKSWTLLDIKIILGLLIILFITIGFTVNAKDKEFYNVVGDIVSIFKDKEK